MVDSIKDGGSAFPSEQGHTPEGLWNQTFEPGMSLRDWFAGQALAACQITPNEGDAIWLEQGGAARIYQIADAMLKARESQE